MTTVKQAMDMLAEYDGENEVQVAFPDGTFWEIDHLHSSNVAEGVVIIYTNAADVKELTIQDNSTEDGLTDEATKEGN